MSRGKKHIPRKPPKQGDERTNSKLRRQFSEYEGETITIKAKIQRFSTAKLGVGVWKETVCVEDVCVLTHNLNWRRICQHIWLHFDKINNVDFLSVYDHLAVLLEQVEEKESVSSTGVERLQKLFPTECREANRAHLPRHRVVGKPVFIVCTHLKSYFLKKQNKQLIRCFYYIRKLILKIKKPLHLKKM